MAPFHLETLGGFVELSMDVVGHVGVIRVRGDLDATNAPTLNEVAVDMLRDGTRDLVIDCRGIEFIDAAGLQAMLRAYEQAHAQGGTVTLRRPSAHTHRLLQITGLDAVVMIDEADRDGDQLG